MGSMKKLLATRFGFYVVWQYGSGNGKDPPKLSNDSSVRACERKWRTNWLQPLLPRRTTAARRNRSILYMYLSFSTWTFFGRSLRFGTPSTVDAQKRFDLMWILPLAQWHRVAQSLRSAPMRVARVRTRRNPPDVYRRVGLDRLGGQFLSCV